MATSWVALPEPRNCVGLAVDVGAAEVGVDDFDVALFAKEGDGEEHDDDDHEEHDDEVAVGEGAGLAPKTPRT
jgi:hypothetical protein